MYIEQAVWALLAEQNHLVISDDNQIDNTAVSSEIIDNIIVNIFSNFSKFLHYNFMF
uniref:Uncharacterized protein n=1 Tax=Arion vulgaris TaxID=1028688 RepID=A0A0B7BJ20_9EUPU